MTVCLILLFEFCYIWRVRLVSFDTTVKYSTVTELSPGVVQLRVRVYFKYLKHNLTVVYQNVVQKEK